MICIRGQPRNLGFNRLFKGQQGQKLVELSQAHRRILSWILILGILCQPVLTYLGTPRAAHTLQGITVLVCTLRGTPKEVRLDLPPIDRDDAAAPGEPCPALELIKMAGIAWAPSLPEVPECVLFSVALVDQTARQSHRRIHFSAYASRAPPLA